MKRVLPLIIACCTFVAYAVYDARAPLSQPKEFILTAASPVTVEIVVN